MLKPYFDDLIKTSVASSSILSERLSKRVILADCDIAPASKKPMESDRSKESLRVGRIGVQKEVYDDVEDRSDSKPRQAEAERFYWLYKVGTYKYAQYFVMLEYNSGTRTV